ncbi:DUF3021 family protein [Eggerthellaceae bacterium 3-80]|nr:DUF3021 family protein [bacterium D16-34]
MKDKIINPEKLSVGNALKDLALNFCIGFTIFMLISMVFGSIFADEQSKEGITICWIIAAIMLGAALLQMLFFTPIIIKQMGYMQRIIAFGAVLYFLLFICGFALHWFAADNLGAIITFTITYLVILGIMSIIFTAIYKKDVAALNKDLKNLQETLSEQK